MEQLYFNKNISEFQICDSNKLMLMTLVSNWGFEAIDLGIVQDNKKEVQKTLIRHTNAINTLSERGMYFFDYGNAFLLEASRAGANILNEKGDFKYPSYVQDIMGPMCFDYGFGPFRWVCSSNCPKDLEITDRIASEVLEEIMKNAPDEINQIINSKLRKIDKKRRKNNFENGNITKLQILMKNATNNIGILTLDNLKLVLKNNSIENIGAEELIQISESEGYIIRSGINQWTWL